MIRFILAVLYVFIVLLLSLIIIPIGLLIGLFSKKAKRAYTQGLVKFYLKTVQVISGAKITYKGLENLPKDESVLYILNHRSIFDIIITNSMTHGPIAFVAKKEMEKLFIFTWWMKLKECLFLDRKDLRAGMEMIKDAAARINDGVSIGICPEGTRNKSEDDMLEFHKGSFKIAEKAKCKLVPIVFNNTEDILEAHFPKIKPAKVTVTVLPPIDTASLSMEEKKALSDTVREQMLEAYRAAK